MPRFLDGITIVNKNGEEIKIDGSILQGDASSLIDGANTFGTLVIRGENDNRFQAADPEDEYDVVNLRYAESSIAYYNQLLDERDEIVSNWLFKDSSDVQIVEGEIEYNGKISSDTNLVNKQYVDNYGDTSFRLESAGSGSFVFPYYSDSEISALFVDWGDGNYDFLKVRQHTYTSPGIYDGHFYFTTKIGYRAFSNCDYLKSIIISGGVFIIEERAFWGCDKLENVIFPDDLTDIKSNAFFGCPHLTNMVIPASVISIGVSAFEACLSLEQVIMKGKTPPALGERAFFSTKHELIIYVPNDSVNIYKAAWPEVANKIQGISELEV